MSPKKKSACTPPKVTKRNSHGLIDTINYVFTEDGFIDWRKMLDDKWLYPNPSKNLRTADTSELNDKDLCILLGGIKELAQVRGYTDVVYNIVSPSSDYVVATCTITWLPNYETENREVIFSSVGDASPNNTESFAKNFLGPIAENRAFVRCVRNFLKINIVAKDEIATNTSAPVQSDIDVSDPKVLLVKLMKEKNIDFEKVKIKLEKENFPNAENFNSVDDIPNIKIFELLNRIQKART